MGLVWLWGELWGYNAQECHPPPTDSCTNGVGVYQSLDSRPAENARKIGSANWGRRHDRRSIDDSRNDIARPGRRNNYQTSGRAMPRDEGLPVLPANRAAWAWQVHPAKKRKAPR